MAAYPDTLPSPLADGFSGSPEKTFIRSDFDAGPARQRSRFTRAPFMLRLSWRFSLAQMAIFKTFFENEINNGAAWFEIKIDIGNGDANYVVRFVEPYQQARESNRFWSVSASIEVENA